MVQDLGRVVSNSEVKRGYFLMDIRSPSIARQAKPGQFLTVRCGDVTSPLLRRPFGFHRINDSGFQVLYEVVGKGTRLLSELKPGNKVDVLGPLGNGFTVPGKTKDVIIVAGGIGVAPLVALAEKIVNSPQSIVHRKPLVLLGARTRNDILCVREFRKLECEIKVSTDDGSQGFKGGVTDLLEDLLSSIDYRLSTIYACGPEAMLKEIAAIARKRKSEAYASLEGNIACGVGACLGCAIETRSGYKLVCEDGPVFNLNEVVWR
ncbi:MAG: dihydroorotate dehydrogenase electron transfer subunit [Candidatus Omnitrophota bacterium]|nr:dihydroorotate dehydrogenase electron transfer subunit [Candidatus Omnitrophota bacterium]